MTKHKCEKCGYIEENLGKQMFYKIECPNCNMGGEEIFEKIKEDKLESKKFHSDFKYGHLIVKDRFMINGKAPDKIETILDSKYCIRYGLEFKVRNMRGDKFQEHQIIYKDDKGNLNFWKGDIKDYIVHVYNSGDMQFDI